MKGVKVVVDKTSTIMKALRMMTQEAVYVGIPSEENAREDDPITNAVIGYINENGSEAAGVPPTPHLVPGVENVAEQCGDIIANAAADAMTGDFAALTKAYNKCGLIAQASVRRVITSQEGFDELAESTIESRKREGFKGTKRLLRSGQYRNSITYVIRKTE